MSHNDRLLHQYLLSAHQDVSLLIRDLECRPFSKSSDSAELLVAVDWSEVYAYLYGITPTADPLTTVLGSEDLATAAHQVALSVLFDRWPVGSLVLLPPYVGEMLHFVNLVQSEVLPVEVDLKERASVLRGLMESESLRPLVDLASASTGNSVVERQRAFIATLNSEQTRRIEGWIDEEFGSLFRLAKISTHNVLGGLAHLLRSAESERPRLSSLDDRDAELALVLERSGLEVSRWLGLLKDAYGGKEPRARQRDAEALAALVRLSPLVHEKHQQLLFVTRGTDIKQVVKDDPTGFLCLASAYFRPFSRYTPNMLRSWGYFFELGLLWAPDDDRRTKQRARERLRDINGRLESLRIGRTSSESLKRTIRADLTKEIQNRRALVSLERPWLPAEGSESISQMAARFFVLYVTEPMYFDAERQRIRDEVLNRMAAVQRTIAFSDYVRGSADQVFEGFFPSTKPLFKTAVDQLPLATFLGAVRDRGDREQIGALLRSVRAGKAPAAAEITRIARLLQDWEEARDPGRAAEVLRLTLCGLYACAEFERLEFFVHESQRMEASCAPPSIWWLCRILMEADVWLAREAPARANVVLRKAWQLLKEAGPLYREDSLVQVALCNYWLLLHLYWTEGEGERVVSFPPRPSDEDGTELEEILDELLELLAEGRSIPRRLRRAMRNNVVYAASRLTPISGLQQQREDRKPRPLLQGTQIQNELLALRKQRKKNANEYDTLGYSYLKLSELEHDRRRSALYMDQALKCLGKASAAVRGKRVTRTAAIVRSHVRLAEDARLLAATQGKGDSR